MSSTTTNLGLTKPAYADEADIAVLNGNMDLLDAAYGNINQSTLRTVPFAIAVSDWSAVTGGFSATFNNAYITETSQEILTYDGSLIDYAKAHIIDEKKSGGGGIVFTTATKPTGTITGKAYVFDNDDHTLPVIIEGTVTPIANGGTGQSSLAGAQSALGITALSEQIASNVFTNNVDANNYTTVGNYHVGIATNQPEGTTIQYGMLNVYTGGSGFVSQIFVDTNNNMYYRYKNSSSSGWLGWQKVSTIAALEATKVKHSVTITPVTGVTIDKNESWYVDEMVVISVKGHCTTAITNAKIFEMGIPTAYTYENGTTFGIPTGGEWSVTGIAYGYITGKEIRATIASGVYFHILIPLILNR